MSTSIKNTAYSLIGLLLLVMAWQLGAILMAERMPLAHLLAPLLAVWPGVAIALSVLGLNLLGDGLRDLLDPRLQRRG